MVRSRGGASQTPTSLASKAGRLIHLDETEGILEEINLRGDEQQVDLELRKTAERAEIKALQNAVFQLDARLVAVERNNQIAELCSGNAELVLVSNQKQFISAVALNGAVPGDLAARVEFEVQLQSLAGGDPHSWCDGVPVVTFAEDVVDTDVGIPTVVKADRTRYNPNNGRAIILHEANVGAGKTYAANGALAAGVTWNSTTLAVFDANPAVDNVFVDSWIGLTSDGQFHLVESITVNGPNWDVIVSGYDNGKAVTIPTGSSGSRRTDSWSIAVRPPTPVKDAVKAIKHYVLVN